MKKTLLFSALLLASSISLSYAKTMDTCEMVPGNWSGSWSAFGYHCSAYGEGYRNGDNVYFNFRVYNCSNMSQNFAMSGRCHDGRIMLANSNAVMTGAISSSRILTIQGNDQMGNFYKY